LCYDFYLLPFQVIGDVLQSFMSPEEADAEVKEGNKAYGVSYQALAQPALMVQVWRAQVRLQV